MTVQCEDFGEVQILLVEQDFSVTSPGIKRTSAGLDFVPLKTAVANIATGFAKEFESIANNATPQEVTVSFSLTLSNSGWLIGVKGEGAATVTLKWKPRTA